MERLQATISTPDGAGFSLRTARLGPLPLVNHFIERLGVHRVLEQHLPADARCRLSHAAALGVLLRSIIVEREPIYRQHETVHDFAPGMFGLDEQQMQHLGDDRLGRALDRLFDADRTAVLTDLVLGAARGFGVRFDELHNDSTTVKLCGSYRQGRGRRLRARTAPAISYGFSKDHRPDLKQLLFILTMSADGNVPVAFRCADGNCSDARTHIETWNTLRAVAGRADFLYVADSKLCTRENMDHIDRAGGRFVTVLPRTRLEDAQFRQAIQTRAPEWEQVWDRPNRRHRDGPRDLWYVHRAALPSMEAWPVVWVWSTLLTLRQQASRARRMAAAVAELEQLRRRLASAKARLRGAAQIDQQVKLTLEKFNVQRYLEVRRVVVEAHVFKQTRRGRPGPDTAYRKITKRRFDLHHRIVQETIDYDRKSDGMYPLLTNDRQLGAAQVLQAHKGQPMIEKRFEQLKTVHEIAPVLLKDEGRIEALFTLYAIALLVQALIERELRRAMTRAHIGELPLYPEQRDCVHPTTEQVLRLFSLAQRHELTHAGQVIQRFEPELTELQRQVLELLAVPISDYVRSARQQ